MALDSPLLARRRVVAAALETTTGTPVALTAAAAAMNVFNAKFKAEIPANQRPGAVSFSPLPPIAGAQKGTLTFETELVGNGAIGIPFWANTLLPGICFPVPGTGQQFSPLTGSQTTLTLGLYLDGRLFTISGAQGAAKITAEVGKPVMIEWTFDGVWQPPTSTAILAPTLPTVLPPRFAGAAMTIGATVYRVGKVEIDIKNTITLREDQSQTSGYHSAFATSREITIKCMSNHWPPSAFTREVT